MGLEVFLHILQGGWIFIGLRLVLQLVSWLAVNSSSDKPPSRLATFSRRSAIALEAPWDKTSVTTDFPGRIVPNIACDFCNTNIL